MSRRDFLSAAPKRAAGKRADMEHHEVIIIGGGPSGLATALALSQSGVKDVVVLEREQEAGGIPRHCGHRGFAPYKNFGLMTGPNLARQLRDQTKGLDIRTSTTVLEFTLRGNLRVHSAQGIAEMSAGKIVLATGTRESSRAARLIGGNKIKGVMNTGELQQRVYLNGEKPFKRPVIVGSEWVSYSTLLTCRHLQVKPVMMLAEESESAAPGYFSLGARLLGTKLVKGAKLIAIHGAHAVEAVEIEQNGTRRKVECDAVVLTGKFRSESALFANGFLEREGWAPKVTEAFKTSRPNIFAVGNVLGHLETAGRCMAQGRELAKVFTA
jgi:thioredoxin reductase